MPITAEQENLLIQALAEAKPKASGCCGLFSSSSPKPLTYEISRGWTNFSRNLKDPHILVFDIYDVPTLQKLMKSLDKLNKTAESIISLHVVAGAKKTGEDAAYSSSYSFTPGASGDVLVRLSGPAFNQVSIKDADQHIVTVGAGVQIGDLNQRLYAGLPLGLGKSLRLSLPTWSLIPFVTVVGLANNAGHGTGIAQPAIAGLITALHFCRADGELIRIDASHESFEDIRGGFFSLFGIVTQVELQCMPAKKLQTLTQARTVKQFIDELKSNVVERTSYLSVMYVPTYDDFSDHPSRNVVIVKAETVPLEVPDQNSRPCLRHWGQELAIRFANTLHIGDLLGAHARLLVPLYMKQIVSMAVIGTEDTLAIGPLPDLAHYQTAFPPAIDDADYLFTFEKGSERVVQAFERIVKLLDLYAKRKLFPIIDGIYLRFFKGTNGGMSTSAHLPEQFVCAFDIVSDPLIPGYKEFKAEVDDMFLNEFEAKPHWGKTVNPTLDYPQRYGASYVAFMAALLKWQQSFHQSLDSNPFLNPFYKTILKIPFDEKPEVVHAEIAEIKDSLVPYYPPKEDSPEIAQRILEDMQKNMADLRRGNDIEALVNLRRRLHTIAEQARERLSQRSVGSPLLFNSSSSSIEERKHDSAPADLPVAEFQP